MKGTRFFLKSYFVALATLIVGVGLSLRFHDWSWFSRSGSLIVVNGIVLTSHQIIEHMRTLTRYQRSNGSQFYRDWASEEKQHFIHDDPFSQWIVERQGFYLLIFGTLIWGFGDLIGRWWV